MIKEEIPESLEEVFKLRLGNVFIASFLISFLFVNWQSVYATFFVSQDVISEMKNVTKINYILDFYGGWGLLGVLQKVWLLIIAPLIGVYLVHWPLAELGLKLYEKDLKTHEEKKLLRDRSLTKKIESEKRVLEAKEEVKEIEERFLTSEEKWEIDLKDFFEEEKFQNLVNRLIDAEYNGNSDTKGFTSSEKAFLESNNIINIDHSGYFVFTEKGRWLVKKFSVIRLRNEYDNEISIDDLPF